MLLFARVTQYCFCSISILLTGLFALSLTGLSWSELEGSGFKVRSLLAAALFLLIGCCIDVGKYLFWMHRRTSTYYSAISIILMLFSLLASCAFFYSAEGEALKFSETQFQQSEVFQLKIQSLRGEIDQQNQLMNLRLSSKYHSQWEEADENSKRIHALNAELNDLIGKKEQEKSDFARKEIVITNFFSFIGNMLTLETETIRGFGYGLLSFFLEISSLGAISLNNSLRKEVKDEEIVGNESDPEESNDFVENQDKMKGLVRDILSGKTPPILRKIKYQRYGVSVEEVRRLLSFLHYTGLLEKDKRNSYKLKDVLALKTDSSATIS